MGEKIVLCERAEPTGRKTRRVCYLCYLPSELLRARSSRSAHWAGAKAIPSRRDDEKWGCCAESRFEGRFSEPLFSVAFEVTDSQLTSVSRVHCIFELRPRDTRAGVCHNFGMLKSLPYVLAHGCWLLRQARIYRAQVLR